MIDEAKRERENEKLDKIDCHVKGKQEFFKAKHKVDYESKINSNIYPLISPNYVRARKQKNFMFAIFLIAVVSNGILQLKNFDFFNKNLNMFLFFFIILEMVVEILLCRIALKELLLVAPILVSLEYT